MKPRLTKGAIITLSPGGLIGSTVVFQYNPSNVSRTLDPLYVGAGRSGRAQSVRFYGPASQTVTVELQLDAADQLDAGDPIAATLGIYPQLAVLEMLLSPSLLSVAESTVFLSAGTIEILPPVVPPTLFVWGAKRVVPIRVDKLTIDEQLFDPNLNPIHATVTLELHVLTYLELQPSNPSFAAFLAYQAVQEGLAATASLTSTASLLGITPGGL